MSKIAFKVLVFGMTVFASTCALASVGSFPVDKVDSCYPQGEARPSGFGFLSSGISEETFNSVLDRVAEVYGPVFEEKGLTLEIVKLWDNPQPNAAAMPHPQDKSRRGILMFGGLARNPNMTGDGFTLVACHEIGHHIGGAPLVDKKVWVASNEGQSDYFAALKCARKVFGQDDNVALMKNARVPRVALQKCSGAFKSDQEVALCLRTTVAGMALASTLKNLTQEAVDKKWPEKNIKIPQPNVATPDQREVEVTDDNHPMPQCRLDSMFQGAICHVGTDKDVSMSDPEKGSCVRRLGDVEGVRPLCWYSTNPAVREQNLIPGIIVVTGGL